MYSHFWLPTRPFYNPINEQVDVHPHGHVQHAIEDDPRRETVDFIGVRCCLLTTHGGPPPIYRPKTELIAPNWGGPDEPPNLCLVVRASAAGSNSDI